MAKNKFKKDTLDKATRLLNEMRKENSMDNNMLRPDHASFNCYSCVIARSRKENKTTLAWDIVKEMDERGIDVNGKELNEVLATCAWSEKSPNRQKNFEIALHALARIHKHWKPGGRCYVRFFGSAIGRRKRYEVDLAWLL